MIDDPSFSWGDAIAGASALFAAITFFFGVKAWRKEFVGKRRIEVAEEALALGYEMRDIISSARSPFGFEGEGKSRTRSPNESAEASRALDRANALMERLNSQSERISKCYAIRYRVMSRFGSEHSKPFEAIRGVIIEMQVSARQLGHHYWQLEPSELAEDPAERENLKRHEDIFWQRSEDDALAVRVDSAIQSIEKLAR